MLAHLRGRGVLMPDATVLERIGLAARARARQRTFQVPADGVTDPAIRRSRFAWLRDAPEAPAPGNGDPGHRRRAVCRAASLSPRFLAVFRFQSGVPHDLLLAAIDLLKAADEAGARALPKRLPSAFLPPKWRRMIFAEPVPDRRPYETAVLATLRDRLRGAGVWVAGSRDYRALENYLLPSESGGRSYRRPCRGDRPGALPRDPGRPAARTPAILWPPAPRAAS